MKKTPVADLHFLDERPCPVFFISMQRLANFGQAIGGHHLPGWHPLRQTLEPPLNTATSKQDKQLPRSSLTAQVLNSVRYKIKSLMKLPLQRHLRSSAQGSLPPGLGDGGKGAVRRRVGRYRHRSSRLTDSTGL